jgi:large subunit ribosomal protein L22
MIRGQRLDQALNIVKFSPQIAVSEDVYVLLNSALANAKQKNPNIRDAKELWVTEAVVNEGMTMKRFRPRAQGRGYQILKRSSQISVVISDDKNYRPDLKSEKEPAPVVEAKVNTEATSSAGAAEVNPATGEEVSK